MMIMLKLSYSVHIYMYRKKLIVHILDYVLNQVQVPTMRNAISLSSVYSGDNITGKKVWTVILFDNWYLESCKYYIYLNLHVSRFPLVTSQQFIFVYNLNNQIVPNYNMTNVQIIPTCANWHIMLHVSIYNWSIFGQWITSMFDTKIDLWFKHKIELFFLIHCTFNYVVCNLADINQYIESYNVHQIV